MDTNAIPKKVMQGTIGEDDSKLNFVSETKLDISYLLDQMEKYIQANIDYWDCLSDLTKATAKAVVEIYEMLSKSIYVTSLDTGEKIYVERKVHDWKNLDKVQSKEDK